MDQTPEISYSALSDGELIELLHTCADMLPREAVDEILERGSRMIPLLSVIVADKAAWTRPMPEWWAVVHATYLLGANESVDALPGLLSALRWADAFDNEWVGEDLPSIFGKIGPHAYPYLMAIAHDISAGWSARTIALMSMASICVSEIKFRAGFFDFASKILESDSEPIPLRQSAANILLDYRSTEHRDMLKAFGREEAARREEISGYEGAFYEWEVDDFLASESYDLDFYQRDWMFFYEPEERQRRHDFWEEERESKISSKSSKSLLPMDMAYLTCPCGSGKHYEDCCKKRVH